MRTRFTSAIRTLLISVVLWPSLLSAAACAGSASGPIEPPVTTLDQTLPPIRAMMGRYNADQGNIDRFHDAPLSPAAAARKADVHQSWLDALAATDFDALDQDGRIDYILFSNLLKFRLADIEHDRAMWEQMSHLLPFAESIVNLHESRRRLEPVDARAAAAMLHELSEELKETRKSIDADLKNGGKDDPKYAPIVGNRAARSANSLRRTLGSWYRFHSGYDPMFTWWVKEPYEKLEPELTKYAGFLREKLAGVSKGEEGDAVIGDPVGREMLGDMLAYEMIPYTPEELIEVAEAEYAWCLNEMLRVSNELGFGDDWKATLNHVKGLHVEPGKQPELIRDLALEAVEFLEERDLVTIPELAKETWRMQMMSPARQKIAPYFLGGESIIVSFPTDGMAHEDKLMSMRGNNRHFARATVHHELIPGHHLQGFMKARFRTHRRIFGTPFWTEGWALYWEMYLWDLDFPQSAEDRVGMLFWRMHRCARIIFSLNFHLEQMTAQDAIEYLIENVGHERNNATAEVRRSVRGDYGPLYQAAYMLGGLQIRALHKDLVESGKMTNREFHDTILRQNSIPIEMVRAALIGQELTRDFETSWLFYGEFD